MKPNPGPRLGFVLGPAIGLGVGLVGLGLSACGGGGRGGAPISPREREPELVFCRSRIDDPHNRTEIRESDRFGLADRKILDRSGPETGVRVAPDGIHIAFARERRLRRPDSREIYVAAIDGSAGERRLTSDDFLDDTPCWSPDGTRIVFSSERFGPGRRLVVADAADGTGLRALHDDGSAQRDPDWSTTTDRLVFSRVDPTARPARARLFTIDPDGRTPVPLTDGGTGAASVVTPGDYEPAFSPDGGLVAFSRVVSDAVRVLMVVDVATGAVTALTAGDVEDRFPRFSPHGDLLLFARSRAADGMPGLRLHAAAADGSEPRLIYPDARFDFLGFDPLPAMPPAAGDRAVAAWVDVAIQQGDVEIVLGRRLFGDAGSVIAADGDVLSLRTREFDGRDRAGLNVGATLPVAQPEDVRAIEIHVRAALDPVGDGAVLRIAVDNHVASRNDTVLEVEPADNGLRDYSFTMQSLAHVSRGRGVQVSVVADMRKATAGELAIELVRLSVKGRAADGDDAGR